MVTFAVCKRGEESFSSRVRDKPTTDASAEQHFISILRKRDFAYRKQTCHAPSLFRFHTRRFISREWFPWLQKVWASVRFVDGKICAHLSKFHAENSARDLFATVWRDIAQFVHWSSWKLRRASSLRVIERACSELLASKSNPLFLIYCFGCTYDSSPPCNSRAFSYVPLPLPMP